MFCIRHDSWGMRRQSIGIVVIIVNCFMGHINDLVLVVLLIVSLSRLMAHIVVLFVTITLLKNVKRQVGWVGLFMIVVHVLIVLIMVS